MPTVAADGFDIGVCAHQHDVPFTQGLVIQRLCKIAVQRNHHFRNAFFRSSMTAGAGTQTEAPKQRSLNGIAIKDFALNG